MNLQVLVSTMHQKEVYPLLEQMNISSGATVINQGSVNGEDKRTFDFSNETITWINSPERGISKSRNLAIKNSS